MGNTCVTPLTTLEMLDAIEHGIWALRSGNLCARAPEGSMETAAMLRAELRAAGISAGEFARLAGVQQDALEGWLEGNCIAPPWVSASIRLVALLTPSARRKLLYSPPAAQRRPADPIQRHPFSQIEDL